ncbi:MAG: Gfo/Idh/MocA family oxidoreductase [Paracoccaceae bacterium]|nr:Gfo/Idh/MocA family oxidoreductase [Paracoccaceae bacterium]
MADRVRIGIVGCGVVASAYYLPYLMRDTRAEIAALCDNRVARAEECKRLFGGGAVYDDYYDMLARAEIDAVFILTAPGTHVPFTLAAIDAGKHVLLQKPMATSMDDARKIAEAVKASDLKVVVEPSSNSPLDPDIAEIRALVRAGVLGKTLWFTSGITGPTAYDKSLTVNPYGQAAFYAKDSGGFLFDMPYAPQGIVGYLGACKSVLAVANIAHREHPIVAEDAYDDFLRSATDPDDANYWDVVLDLPRDVVVPNEAYDNVYSIYEMADGSVGALHIGRVLHPVLPGSGSGALQAFGTDGNLICGAGHQASIITNRRDLLPSVDDDGWYHQPVRGDLSKAKWPQPVPGGFNYYHASSKHLIDCIVDDLDPIPDVDWGLHITEMMAGAAISSETGRKYEMTTTLDY